jgi:parallel beta-helix repeat protein
MIQGAPFNVLDYGAVGDGITDVTANIQAAIDACYAAGGGVVRIPPASGSYRVTLTYQTPTSASFHKSALWIKDGVIIDATGATIEALLNIDTHGGFISYSGRSDAHVIGGTWIGDKALHGVLPTGEWCFAFIMSASARCTIKNALIKNSRGDGVYIGGTPTATFDSAEISYDIEISGNQIINCGRNGISVVGAQRYVIADNIITGTYGYAPEAGIDVEPNYTYANNWGSSDGVITGNVITENYGDGITLYRSAALTVSGNTCSKNGQRGISVRGDLYTVSITGNTVQYAGLRAAADADSLYGLYVDQSAGANSNLNIADNTVNAARCFYVSSGDCQISGNKFLIDSNAANQWGALGTGTANRDSYFTSTISSAGTDSVRFTNNSYRVGTTATFRGEATFLLSLVRGAHHNNTFYNVNAAGGVDIRLDGASATPHEFHYNACNDNLRVGQDAVGWWSASVVDFSRSILNGAKATYIFIKPNSPATGWVMPDVTGNTYEYAFGYVSGSTYKFRTWDGATWKLYGVYV